MVKNKTTISIDGKNVASFETLSLMQSINDHHHFEVTLDMGVIEKMGTHTIEASKDWLGKAIVITFNEKEFLGTIVNVQMLHTQGFDGHLVISGYSKTILLEGGPHVQSWLEKDLGTIVKDVTDAGGVEADVNPVFKTPFDYQAQYGETHFQFLQRLAKQHNEWFYYDGVKLIFGKPTLGSPIEMEYGLDLDSISISIEAVPSKQNRFTYNPLDDKKEESKTKDQVAGLNELGTFAFNQSKELFGIVPNNYSHARVKDKDQIDAVIKNKQGSAVAKSNVLRGTSRKQGLSVGTVIKVSTSFMTNGNPEVKNYGEFIITSISHVASGINEYSNQFEAIASGVEYLPEPNVDMPVAQPQIATVLSNADPKNKGRVEVQFQWQTGEMKTSWIRVMTPDAGSSDEVGTNRGFVFIPEDGDQVMVGFRYNDPNRPFVMGSMFSGSTGAGGSDGNKTKSITTRSGSTIIFDDDAGSITIVDAKQNSVTLDGDGTVAVSANSTISLTTGESSINMSSDGNIDITAKNITVSGSETTSMASGSNAFSTDAGGATADVSAMEVNVSGMKSVAITGQAKSTISSSGTTSIEGTIVKLN